MRALLAAAPALMPVLLLTGCGGFSQADADAVTAKCGAPADMLTVAGGKVTFHPRQNLDDPANGCVYDGARAAGAKDIAFVHHQ